MAVNTKEIQYRIKSVKNTKKITKAMEMISAAKMKKATDNVLKTRSYASLAWEMLSDVSVKADTSIHPLLEKREVKKLGILLVSSNRGLCGGFVAKLLTQTDKYIKELKKTSQDLEVEVVVMGKKGTKIYKYYGHTISSEFEKQDLTTKIEEILPIARTVTGDFISKKYDKVVLAYTDFISPVNQEPRIKELLPLGSEDEMLGQAKRAGGQHTPNPSQEGNSLLEEGREVSSQEFKFEPSPVKVLEVLLPKLVEMQVYQAILESDASEHSARMMAMRNASDAAGDMIDDLTLTFNKARQSAITQEISEIVGGAAALE